MLCFWARHVYLYSLPRSIADSYRTIISIQIPSGPVGGPFLFLFFVVVTRATIEVYLFVAIFFPNDGAP